MANKKTQHTKRPAIAPRRCAGGRDDRRGSAIVLVLVSCVLMALLAGTLLQITRFERIPQTGSNIDAVVESVIDEVINQLTDDILDNNGRAFNNLNTTTNGGGDEPWDFPWTNPRLDLGRTYDNNGTTIPVMGGAFDDTWLASTAPDFRPTADPTNTVNVGADPNGIWRKVTSLTGMFIGGTGGTRDLSTVDIPNTFPVTARSGVNSDSNIPLTSNLLVDADGDGLGDSRWEWAPLRQIGTLQYVMAVRIIDLSARVDLNVATGRFDNTEQALPRGDSPAELDGNRFAIDMGLRAGAPGALEEWRALLNFRLTGNPTSPAGIASGTAFSYDKNTTPATPGSRREYWERGASQVSAAFARNGLDAGAYDYSSSSTFNATDAFELLLRNGLNNAQTTRVEEIMPTLLRDGSAEPNFSSPTASVSTNDGNTWGVQQFFENDPRKHFSPYTGSMIAAVPFNFNQDLRLKVDVNEAVKDAGGRNVLRNTIIEIIRAQNRQAQLLNRFRHFPNDTNGAQQFADQLTANIADYIDRDNQITVQGSRAGFEVLPYITELYTQRLYNATAVGQNAAGDPTIQWDSPNRLGYAVEIGNPFARWDGSRWVGRPVRLDNVHLRINGFAHDELSTLAGRNQLEPGEVLIVYRDSNGLTADPALHNLSSIHTRAGLNQDGNHTNVIYASSTRNLGGNQLNNRFELFAEIQGTDVPASWAYSGIEIRSTGNRINEVLAGQPSTDIEVDHQAFVTTHYQGHGEGLRMMTMDPRHAGLAPNGYVEERRSHESPSINNNAMSGAAEIALAYPTNFGNEDKAQGPTTFAELVDQQIVWPDSPRERMLWVGDILQIPVIGFEHLQTGRNTHMSRNFFGPPPNNSTSLPRGVESLLLPYRTSVDVPPAERAAVVETEATTNPNGGRGGVRNIPHGLLLLEQLTTYSPASDGRDGDGQGLGIETVPNPNLDEALTPGRLNLNTASQATLESVLPINDLALRRQYAQAIVNRRESLRQFNQHRIGANNLPGIQHVSSLYEQLNRVSQVSASVSEDGNDTRDVGSIRVDLNDYQDSLNNFPFADGVIDDREEELLFVKWLSEMTSTRSDVFAAYIVVQGYPADGFTAGVVESARVIVIFSRANVQGQGDRAVEVARLRIQ